jgi:hypothetical protein
MVASPWGESIWLKADKLCLAQDTLHLAKIDTGRRATQAIVSREALCTGQGGEPLIRARSGLAISRMVRRVARLSGSRELQIC